MKVQSNDRLKKKSKMSPYQSLWMIKAGLKKNYLRDSVTTQSFGD